MPELPKAYNPRDVEKRIYQRWEKSGYFNPDNLPGRRTRPFVISMPPPNITGELHFGHALGMTTQDVLIRYHRMAGDKALWLPGTDHAAISTQVVVERELRKQGIDRQKLGRAKFIKKVWEWKKKYGGRIVEQIKAMGASADWSRERFTLDDQLTDAVHAAFIKLYRDGYIYRGERIINWCADCQTAVSDLEVDHQDVPGHLWYINYPLVDGSGQVTVATTRPETLLGDTAVAVNPQDDRYKGLVGKMLRLPIANREVPIIADARIDKDFGTGAVKVTPAHDPLDFDLGQDHHLQSLQILGLDGKMTALAGQDFSGLSVDEARTKVLDRLRQSGALSKEEDYIHAVGFCQRSKTPIEPLVSRQWFMKMKDLAQPAIDAVRLGQVRILPERYAKVYFHWMENIRDWNISRQIWWGHRLPVWYEKKDKDRTAPRVSAQKPGPNWVQDEDTLDTWFSSGLWTFSTLGWPGRTKELKMFHPTDVLETGWDILFFWVARMMMFSLYFLKEVPFKTIYLHGLILDEQGKKMSKSKGTGIDPLPVAERFGMDAVRMSLIVGNAPGQDFRLYEKKIEGYRNFANKLWNVARFIYAQPRPTGTLQAKTMADRWIVSELQALVAGVTKNMKDLDLSSAGTRLYSFLWHDFADWYIESSKVGRNDGVLYYVLERFLQLLHPFMPFITEQLWQQDHDELLMIAPWPKDTKKYHFAADETAFATLQKAVVALRNFRTHSELPSGATVRFARGANIDAQLLRTLSGISAEPLDHFSVTSGYQELVLGDVRFQVQTEYVQRYESWRAKEKQSLESYIAGVELKLSNRQFVEHAPTAIVEGEREKLNDARRRLLEL